MSNEVYVPLTPPLSTITEDPRNALSEHERELYTEVLGHFSEDGYKFPGVEADPTLTEREKFWLSRECLLRFLRGSKWKSNIAIERLESTLRWRREYGLYDKITPSYVEPEAVTGKEVMFGYDTNNRPGLYLFPSRQNTTDPVRQLQFGVWMFQCAIDVMGPGVETVDLLINFADRTSNPTFSTARAFLSILQDHYPERLGLALIINVPFLVYAFFKLITPLMDPVTREKMKFNPDVIQGHIFAPEQAMNQWWGGNQNFVYQHEKYWPALVEMWESTLKERFSRWKELGGTIGIREWDYKQGPSQASVPVLPHRNNSVAAQ